MKTSYLKHAVAIAALAMAGSAGAGVIVSNAFNGGDGGAYQPLGETNTTTYGQTFVTPDAVNVQLDSFSFFVKSITASNSKLKGYVAEWNGNGITGPVLYTSPEVDSFFDIFTELTFSTGGITLDANKTYVAFMSAAGLFDGTEDLLRVGTNNFTDSYAGGEFVFDNSTGAFPGASWDGCVTAFNCADLAFNFAFDAVNAVPAPATWSLLGLSLVGAGLARRRRAA